MKWQLFKKQEKPKGRWHRKEVIPVFFACDDNYIKYLLVTVTSLVRHISDGRRYDLHVLNTGLTEENCNKVSALSQSNVRIVFDDVSKPLETLRKRLAIRDYYSCTTYYRFFIPSLYPHLDKALYLDSDTVILSDVAKLYHMEMGKNLIGAVPDMLVKNTDIYKHYAENVLNVSSAAYFNAGVVLINCEQFRKQKICDRFVELLNAYTFTVAQDQDYLNVLCQDKILWIDSKWNVQMTETFLRERKDIAIVHYNLAEKPWHYSDGRYGEYFWKYAAKTADYEELKQVLADFGESERERDRQYGRNLLHLATEEINNRRNYRRMLIPDVNRAITRQEIVEKIIRYEKEGRFDEDVENDPPGRMLMPEEIEYLNPNTKAKLRTKYAFTIARWFMTVLMTKHQLIFKEIRGIENMQALKGGAVITCNHFNALDSFAVQHFYEKSGQNEAGHKLYRVIKEGNYTSFPGFYGFLMRNCNTLPLSSNFSTMRKFMKAVNRILQRGDYVLVYAEQSMWWNYRKPKPLKIGAFSFAAQANVPVLPVFVTMEDSDVPGEGGFPVQEYTIHIAPAIYPDPHKSKSENAQEMLQENQRVWREIYESFYGIPLTYLTETPPSEEPQEARAENE